MNSQTNDASTPDSDLEPLIFTDKTGMMLCLVWQVSRKKHVVNLIANVFD